jgi:uncharacterized protein involved in exopolysaccharide biosynthesis
MSSNEHHAEDDEISLIDLFSVLWRRRVMIIAITMIAAVFSVVFSIISKILPSDKSPLPDQYTPKALIMVNGGASGGGLSAALGNLGGLASLAGVNLPSLGGGATGEGTNAELAIFVLKADTFLDEVVDKFNLIERWEIEKYVRASSREKLSKLLTAEKDKDSGVIILEFTDKDPVFATEVLNFVVQALENRFDVLGLDKNKLEKENLEINMANSLEEVKNLQIQAQGFNRSFATAGTVNSAALEASRLQIEIQAQAQVYTQLKTQYELLKVTMASEKPVFQVLELAQTPDKKSKPSRGLLCIIVTFAGGFLATFMAFAQNAIENVKRDPLAMAKLRGEERLH